MMETDAEGIGERFIPHQMPLDRRKSASTAGDGEQGDTCRICRGEATSDQPLFYPCKCSGSIKFVHQDCLMEWLSHSQKKYCELCKTPFRFTKLYDDSMPESLPMPLFLRQVGVHALRTLGRWTRYFLVIFIWTCWLPWSIRQIWRGLFWLADGSWMTAHDLRQWSFTNLAMSGSNTSHSNYTELRHTDAEGQHVLSAFYVDPVGEMFHLMTGAPLLRGLLRLLTPKPASISKIPPDHNVTSTVPHTLTSRVRQPSLLSNVSSLNSLTKYQIVNNGLIDILEGQLVCLSIIAAFILVFLIREWVINQQPILNMPNPDQADMQPAPAPPNEEGRQPGRRRRRGIRRLPERDEQAENRVADLPHRPTAVVRPHHTVANETIALDGSPPHDFQFHDTSRHVPSLGTSPREITNIADEGPDDEFSWGLQDPLQIENLESPPLQRGIFDDVVDIRRNIEEKMAASVDGNDSRSGDLEPNDITRLLESSSMRPAQNSGSAATTVTNQVELPDQDLAVDSFGEIDSSSGRRAIISAPFNVVQPQSVEEFNENLDPETTTVTDPYSPWEGINSHQSVISLDSSAEPMQLLDIPGNEDSSNAIPATAQELGQESIQEPLLESTLSQTHEPRHVGDNPIPETLLDRFARWMWHTDELIRGDDSVAAQIGTNDIPQVAERGQIPQAADALDAGAIQQPANVAPNEPNAQFGVNVNDPNALEDAEDLEGILELIGMEGPLSGMIQNIIFSVFLITLTLSASVWCPYIWGKIAILILSNPVGVFFKAPLFLISKCGNVLVDLLLFVGGMAGFGLSNVTKLIKVVIAPALPKLAAHIRIGTIESWAYQISQNSGIRLEKALSGTLFGLRPDLPTFSMQSHHALRVFRAAFAQVLSGVSADVVESINNAIDMWQSYGIFGLPAFVLNEIFSFPSAAVSAAKATTEWWYALRHDLQMPPLPEMSEREFALVEWTTEDKICAIIVGYAFFAIAGYAHLKLAHAFLGLKKDEKVDGIFADSLRQAGGVLKVIIIIGIEMIAFPLYCGLLLDCALLPLFRDATFQSRLTFLVNAPITCIFIHWFVGTCYMFHFALFVSMCRKIMRKGVLYFIRDPDDPTFHPVRDVLERPVATQLGKIAFSALVYGGLVIVCLGGVVWSVSRIGGILPIHWGTTEPRLAFPIDIIFYNFMLPFILKRTEPSKKVSAAYEWWFRQCARNLRLTHFLFGDEREDEKRGSPSLWYSSPIKQDDTLAGLRDQQEIDQNSVQHERHTDGRYVRVPAADSVRIPKGTKVFVEVNESNERIDGEADRDTGLHGKNDDRFIKVYIPVHFKARISVFVFMVWLFSSLTGAAFTILPLTIGRQFLRRVAQPAVAPNDLYAFTIGLHVCGVIAFGGYTATKRRRLIRSRVSELVLNTRDALPRLFEVTKYIFGLFYLFAVVFIVLPFATSLLTELYVHMPIYSYFSHAHSTSLPPKRNSEPEPSAPVNPSIFILQTWTLGIIYLRLALRFVVAYPDGQNRPSTAIKAIVRNGYFHPDVALASRALILPALTLCIVLLAAPIGLARLTISITSTVNPEEKLHLYRYSYPFVLGVAASVYLAVGVQRKIQGWRIKVRDEVYLIGERLHNFSEPENTKPSQTANHKDDKQKSSITTEVRTLQQGPDPHLDMDAPQTVGEHFDEMDTAMTSGSSVW